MGLLSYCLLPLLALAAVNAGTFTLQAPRFTISGPDAQQIRSETISLSKTPEILTLGSKDTLKLTFQVIVEEGWLTVQPHQTFLRFYDKVTGEEGIQPVRVTSSGRGKFELNMARPPPTLPPSTSSNPISVSLLLGSFEHTPAKFELFDVFLPESQPAPVHELEHTFHPQPPLAHTFRPDQKLPPNAIAVVFAALVLTPWAVLIGFWSQIKPSVPHLLSPHIAPFIATLGAFEALLFWYWVDLKLGQVLLYGGILSLFTAMAGKQALATKGDWRIGRR